MIPGERRPFTYKFIIVCGPVVNLQIKILEEVKLRFINFYNPFGSPFFDGYPLLHGAGEELLIIYHKQHKLAKLEKFQLIFST